MHKYNKRDGLDELFFLKEECNLTYILEKDDRDPSLIDKYLCDLDTIDIEPLTDKIGLPYSKFLKDSFNCNPIEINRSFK